MSLALSTGLRNALLDTGANGGGSWIETFTNCIIRVFDGAIPTDADTTEGAANMLVEITLDGLTFVPGAPGNGLNFGQVAAGQVFQASGETWEGTVGVQGEPAWFRIYDNAVDTGDSAVAVRADGTVGISGSGEDMEVDATLFGLGKLVSLFNAVLTIPA